MKNTKTLSVQVTNTDLFKIAYKNAINNTAAWYYITGSRSTDFYQKKISPAMEKLINAEKFINNVNITEFLASLYYLSTATGKCRYLTETERIWYQIRNHDRVVVNWRTGDVIHQFTYRIIFERMDDPFFENLNISDIAVPSKEFINALIERCRLQLLSERKLTN